MSVRLAPWLLVCILACLLQASGAIADDEDGGWHHEVTEDGVSVSLRNEPGRDLPVFRGVGKVDAGLFDILAVLDDTPRLTDWMANCIGSKVIKQVNEFDRIIYNRTDSPWPVSDRDVVLSATVQASLAKKEVWCRFSSTTSAAQGPVDGVVRMPRLRGYYRLQAIDDTHTKVTYQIDADPGGMLPDWLVTRATKQLPIQTIVGMRKQVKKMAGKYNEFIRRFDPSQGGKIPEQFEK